MNERELQTLHAKIFFMSDSEVATNYLSNFKKSELIMLAKYMSLSTNTSKDNIISKIVSGSVGFRLRTESIMGGIPQENIWNAEIIKLRNLIAI